MSKPSLSRAQIVDHLRQVEAKLMDFQRASLDALHAGMFDDDRRRMLLADEVGLGKTIVARGLIARLLREQIEARRDHRPLRVTYICSNQVLARENLRKLDPLPPGVTRTHSRTRIALLAFTPRLTETDSANEQRQPDVLELNSLTPATSFDLASGLGDREERKAIYATLCRVKRFKNEKRARGLEWILKGSVDARRDEFFAELRELGRSDDAVRSDLPQRFVAALRREIVEPGSPGADLLLDEIFPRRREGRRHSLLEALTAFSERVDGRNWGRLHKACHFLAQRLRACLVDCCLHYVRADLYILDEFQRFQNLIAETEGNEAADLARRVFARRQARVLLLSATPFKAFTTDDEQSQGEDHFREFKKVLSFLLHERPDDLVRLDASQRDLHRQLLNLRDNPALLADSTHRDALQGVLRSVICRTERRHAADRLAPLVADTWLDPAFQLSCTLGDVENFLRTDALARVLDRPGFYVGKPVEFCKSAPFPLSFLDRYHFKETLRERLRVGDEAVRHALARSAAAWLDLDGINDYRWEPVAGPSAQSSVHARLALLMRHAIGDVGHRLLWTPPCLPYYPLSQPFSGAEGFSKTLVFSAWLMVPRMIATLLSYEVERRTVADPTTIGRQETREQRTYFTEEKQRRHPLPQLRFQMSGSGAGAEATRLVNFTLLYPSLALARVVDPVANLHNKPLPLAELLDHATESIQRLIDEADLARWATPDGEPDRWYWAAAPLLDVHVHGVATAGLAALWPKTTWRPADAKETPDQAAHEDVDARASHVERFVHAIENPRDARLGKPPKDLARTLAWLALGSPAVLALRGLLRLAPASAGDPALAEPGSHRVRAARIAEGFFSLYNKPESIAAIRLVAGRDGRELAFWEQAARYAAGCCLQSTIDEYLHLLLGQNPDADQAVSQFVGAIHLNTASIQVDDLKSFLSPDGKPRKMRCHYAVEFGSQKIETDKGKDRAVGLRQVFNSPFRPFVLATTSIGQEGLDFHAYCRRIVHWNLPSNPVDFEQREGRVNRFKSLAIRQIAARKFGARFARQPLADGEDPWAAIFRLAQESERSAPGACDLIPAWHIDPEDGPKIERVVPIYPFSSDGERLRRMLRTLTFYRLAFGQPRQTDLVEHLLGVKFTAEQIAAAEHNLLVDLRPTAGKSRGAAQAQ